MINKIVNLHQHLFTRKAPHCGEPLCVKKRQFCHAEDVGANSVRPPTQRSNAFSGKFLTWQMCASARHFFDNLTGAAALRQLPFLLRHPTKKALPQNGQGRTGFATKGYHQHKGATRRRQALSMLPKNPFRQSFRPIWREADSIDSKSRKISCSTSPP